MGIALVASSSLSMTMLLWYCFTGICEDLTKPPSFSDSSLSQEGVALKFSENETENPLFSFALPKVSKEMSFHWFLPRPGSEIQESGILVCCKPSLQSKKVFLPCRLDLQYQAQDRLGFAAVPSCFWIDLLKEEGGKIQAVVFVEMEEGMSIETERFTVAPEDCPLTQVKDLAEASPIRELAEAVWIGKDLLAEKFFNTSLQRIRIGRGEMEEMVELGVNDFLVWNGRQWKKEALPKEGRMPIAKAAAVDARGFVFEGWDGDTPFRIGAMSAPLSAKTRVEDIIHSVRIRSDKQISCMMEKQCLILRSGDWVVKTDAKWKILRRAEEKSAYRMGKWQGELFVLEKIDAKAPQKRIQGVWLNPDRTQLIPVDIGVYASSVRKRKERS